MTTVGLFDTLTVEALRPRQHPLPQSPPAADGHQDRAGSARRDDIEQPPPGRERAGAARVLLLSSDRPGLPVDETNLVVRAAECFAQAIADDAAGDVNKRDTAGPSPGAKRAGAKSGSEDLLRPTAASGVGAGVASRDDAPAMRDDGEVARVHPVAAVLEKRIPLGAGLGGGSSDAARTLEALNRLWQTNWPAARLSEVAGRLGSDVPFFLHGPSSVCTGRGEVVRPVPRPRPRWVVLVLPDVHMPTPAVYRRFDEMGLGFDPEIENPPDWLDWAKLPAKDLLARLVNDLEAPAFDLRPALGTLRADAELKLQRPVRMSGSGSSLFTLYDGNDAHEAERAASGISARFGVTALAVGMTPDLSDDPLNAGNPAT